MLELGSAEVRAHQDVAEQLLNAGFSLIAALGAFQPAFRALSAPDGVSILYPPSVDGAAEELKARLEGDEVLLVKGSRGMRLEGVVEALRGGMG